MEKEKIVSVLKSLYDAGGSDNMENIVKRAPDAATGNTPLGRLVIYNPTAKTIAQELYDLGYIDAILDQLTTPVKITAAGIKFLQDKGMLEH